MGITGLIPFLDKASSKVHLKEIRGCTVAIDSYCWLHKGVFSCADKLVRGEDTDQYINYCMKYVLLLLSYNIKPILVFDGRHLPAKALTERRRRESRQESRKRAVELLRLGKIEESRSHMRRCVDVTHEMALKLIKECRLRNVDCIVAPYEADAEMAWLNKEGLVEYVITEDSDLTLFGARKIIFKLDLNGSGLLVEASKLHLAMGCREERYTFDKFRRMCILSGCDYLDSLPGIGLAKACKFILKTEETDMRRALKKIPQYLNMRHLQVDDDYIENFFKAEATFNHMFIYNPLKRKMERLHAVEKFQTKEEYCCNAGSPLQDDEQALQLALGNVDPFTLKSLDNWHPDIDLETTQKLAARQYVKRAKHKSIWQKAYDKNDNQLAEKSTNVCALFFKKVNFVSKIAEADKNESMLREKAKPEENEICSFYQREAANKFVHSVEDDLLSPNVKRRKLQQEDESASNLKERLEVRSRCNPFASSNNNCTPSSPLKSTKVCVSNSLLKVLSPRKVSRDDANLNSVSISSTSSINRRCLFNKQSNAKVEVKSRFFAANVKEFTQNCSQIHEKPKSLDLEVDPLNDITAQIDEVEKLSQELRKNQAQLYNSPSPNSKPQRPTPKNDERAKTQHLELTSTSCTDSGIVDSLPNSQSENEHFKGAPKDLYSLPIDNSADNAVDEAISLSDSDCEIDIQESLIKSTNVFRRKRLSLTAKPKLKSTTTKKSTSIISATAHRNVEASQPRLSMFGFQKRSVLKYSK